jgi:hypothetical protein
VAIVAASQLSGEYERRVQAVRQSKSADPVFLTRKDFLKYIEGFGHI